MAITNQERVGKALELFRTGLAPYVEREFANVHKDKALAEARRLLPAEDRINGTRPIAKDSDFCTVKQVTEVMVATLGPLAQLLREVCERQQAIEDHIGYVHPVVAPSVAPQQTDGGDVE